jgi:hypothetical protein
MADIQRTVNGPSSVYRYYDHSGVLLYVGVTSRGMARNAEHDKSKPWWHYVATQQVDHYETRADALEAEERLIRSFRPPFNVQHNPFHAEVRRAYEQWTAEGQPSVTVDELISVHSKRIALWMVRRTPECNTYLADPAFAEVSKLIQPRKQRRLTSQALGGSFTIGFPKDRLLVKGPGHVDDLWVRVRFASQKPPELQIIGVES